MTYQYTSFNYVVEVIRLSGQDPDPAVTAGLEVGGGVAPGDTPPVSDSSTGPTHAPPQRTRAPAVLFLGAIGFVVVLIALGLIARIAGLF